MRVAWALAVETLSWMELRGLGERLSLAKTTKQMGIRDSEAVRLAYKLVFETVRRQNFIDFLINSALAPRSLHDFRLGTQAFLRLYTHETKLMNGDFERAVSIAQVGRSILGWRELKEIEEVLGNILSIQPDHLFKGLSDEEKVGLTTFHPTWFVKYCFRLFGRQEALKFLENAAEIPPTYVRINTLKGLEETVLKRMEAEGVILEVEPNLQHTYKVVESQKTITRTESFREGLFYVQDKASSLASEVANPESGMTVIDVCAAPGAKTSYLAQLMINEGVIYSVDYSRRRMEVWKRETERMGVKIAVPLIADACNSLPLRASADLLILDPPCTSTGVFGRVPSAKWRLTKKSLLRMAKLQWRMLNICCNYVNEGGYLVYSTCSISVEENEMLIGRFLKLHPDFKLVDAKPKIGSDGLRGLSKSQRLYPHLHGCNGFFVVKLVRV